MSDEIKCPHCGQVTHIGGLIGPRTNDCPRCGKQALGPSPAAQAYSLRQRARWHREQAEDYLNNSAASMRQHERAADELEEQADKLEQPA